MEPQAGAPEAPGKGDRVAYAKRGEGLTAVPAKVRQRGAVAA